uniref:Uncharacterized protein n=1 Tax=Arundo donax TaxID=35708 RepID=A0A0A9BUQ5_ARUDO
MCNSFCGWMFIFLGGLNRANCIKQVDLNC